MHFPSQVKKVAVLLKLLKMYIEADSLFSMLPSNCSSWNSRKYLLSVIKTSYYLTQNICETLNTSNSAFIHFTFTPNTFPYALRVVSLSHLANYSLKLINEIACVCTFNGAPKCVMRVSCVAECGLANVVASRTSLYVIPEFNDITKMGEDKEIWNIQILTGRACLGNFKLKSWRLALWWIDKSKIYRYE